MATGQDDDVKAFVLKKYSEVGRSAKRQGCGPATNPCCCGGSEFSPAALATALGYSPDEIALPPKGAHLGLSCGNPLAIAELRSGETVLDLGSGGGFDCFLAAPSVGPQGRVIGIDMTPR